MLVGVSSAGGMKRDPLPFVQPIPPFRRMRKKERGEKRSAVKAKEAGSRKSNQISLIQLCGIEDFAMCLAGCSARFRRPFLHLDLASIHFLLAWIC